MAKTRSAGLVLALVFAAGLPAAPAHDKSFWREIVNNRYALPAGEAAYPLARELSAALASPDPELRDGLAYEILARWIADPQRFSPEELRSLAEEWGRNLGAGIGEKEGDAVFRRSFSALCLAELAKRDLAKPFLGADGYRSLLARALEYLGREEDLRGFDARKGWIHATAHTADLLASLAGNPLFTRADQAALLEAAGKRLRSPVFTYGEQDRLAHAVAALVAREDFDQEAFAGWLAEMDRGDLLVWREFPPQLDLLWRYENSTYFLEALAAQLAPSERPAARSAQQQILKALARR